MSTTYYLVKNGETIQDVCADYSSFESYIAGEFYLSEIECALMNMKQVKFSTQLTDSTAKRIVKIHKKREDSVKLAVIIPKVLNIIKSYNNFQWNRDKIENEQKRRTDTERIHISFIKNKIL